MLDSLNLYLFLPSYHWKEKKSVFKKIFQLNSNHSTPLQEVYREIEITLKLYDEGGFKKRKTKVKC